MADRRAARDQAVRAGLAALACAALVAGCGAEEPAAPPATSGRATSGPTSAPAPDPSTRSPDTSPDPGAEPFTRGPDMADATAAPQDVLTGLTTPWDVAFLPGGAVLITLRDPGQVLLLDRAGAQALTGPGAQQLAGDLAAVGEGGLLGVAVSPDVEQDRLVYLYRTTPSGNQVVRAELDPDARTLGPLDLVLGGIPSSSIHNGGRIAFGPDGLLYVATGDATVRGASQDPESLAGKILRITADGRPAPGNPFGDSPVWSLGHRNVQGLGWDDGGRLVASEFGQNRLDELNVIEPGANYGWPQAEGPGGGPGTVDPVVTWGTDEASPSGIAVTDEAVYLAALGGERLWEVPLAPDGAVGEPQAHLVGELGRLRHVAQGPDGALWVLTQNTDGRGSPRPGDDRLVRLLPP